LGYFKKVWESVNKRIEKNDTHKDSIDKTIDITDKAGYFVAVG